MQMHKRTHHLVLIVLVFILVRLLFLFFTPYSFYDEEAKEGSLGHDLIFEGGLRLPFWGYLDSPHAGGSILAGVSAIPFYLLFGDRYLALKITALCYSIGTVLLWYFLLAGEIKDKKQFLYFFLVIFSFGTPHYLQKSVILIGNTAMLMFCNALIIFYFWKYRAAIVHEKNRAFLLGVLCGFSFWVQCLSLHLLATIFLFLFLHQRAQGVKKNILNAFIIVAGFLFGSTPLWIYNIHYHWATFTADPVGLSFAFNVHKLWHLLCIRIPASFHFLDFGYLKAQFFGYELYVLFWIAAIIHSVKCQFDKSKNRGSNCELEYFLTLYLAVVIFIMALTNLPVGGHDLLGWNSMSVDPEYYIVFLQPIIFALFILFLRHRTIISSFIKAAVVCIMLLGYAILFREPVLNHNMLQPMHSTGANVLECGFYYFFNPKLFFSFENKIPPVFEKEYFKGAGAAAHDFLYTETHKIKNIFDNLQKRNVQPEIWSVLLLEALGVESEKNKKALKENYNRLRRLVPSEVASILEEAYQEKLIAAEK